jgi:coproporphyrinogen III oxidase-like Fe-S oxidoreductase
VDEYIINNESYLGIGSGAFSLLDCGFYATTFDIEKYVQDSFSGAQMFVGRQQLSKTQQQRYQLLTALFGLSVSQDVLTEQRNLIECLVYLGVVEKQVLQHPVRLTYALTKKGRYWWLVLMREFFMGVNRYRRDMRSLAGL